VLDQSLSLISTVVTSEDVLSVLADAPAA
jgi:hypothetical protein